MATTMTARTGEFLLSEAPGTLSRESVVIAGGAGKLAPGTVLGQITVDTATASTITGTGNATCSSVTAGTGAQVGAHKLIAISATKLELFDPSGELIGLVTAGTAATLGGLTFTITAGGTAMVAGDLFTLTVAAGTGEYVAYDDDNNNGSDVAVGILLAATDASSAAQDAVIITRLAEVSSAKLVWASTNDANDKTAGLADLAARYILARS